MPNSPQSHRTRHGRDARVTFLPFVAVCLGVCALTTGASAQTVELVNNQPFDIRMPLKVRGLKLQAGSALAQQAGADAIIMVDVPASQSRTLSLGPAAQQASPVAVGVKPDGDGLAVTAGGKDMGRFAWGVVVDKAPADPKKGEPQPSTKRDFAGAFKPVSLKFTQTAEGPLFGTWAASGSDAGLKLDVEVHAYATGFLDVKATVTNESAPARDVYAAVVCRWEQPKVAGRTLCYDNRRQELNDGNHSPFREGEGRHLYIQRGADWVNTRLADGPGVVLMHDFAPSFTFHRQPGDDAKKNKLAARWVGANAAHLGQETQAKDGALYSVVEIARPNLSMYAARLEDNILPPPGESLSTTSRFAFDEKPVSDDAADQRFVAYVGYNPQQLTKDGAKVTFGVPFARMGTNYFPYSTLGENFGALRMAGMSKEGYWPLAPQTVLQWERFADDVRRDLRILKAMGYELCRLHHVELLWDVNPKTGQPYIPSQKRWEYLDFFFKEIEHLQLKVLLDVKLPPADVAEVVKRYRKLIDGVEYDNEILIFQIFDEDVPVWKEVYDAVKKVAPEVPFHLTAHTNMGAFDRLRALGVKVDRIGQHAYLDGVEPIPSSRDYALASANYAAKVGLEPQITEWNWRFLTRMPLEDRAKVYAPIFENPLAARCMPTMYQFQFQDSLAMNPTSLKGIRRYEQLLLSRRPKPEAMEMMKLIRRYTDPKAAWNVLRTEYQAVDLSSMPDGKAAIKVSVTNRGDQPETVSAAAEDPGWLTTSIAGDAKWTLKPGETATALLQAAPANGADALPGFYHTFVRFTRGDGGASYAWVEVRKPGQPPMERSTGGGKVSYGPGALDFDLNRPLTVVYPDKTTIPELEAAWTVFITLESATGRPVEIYQESDLAKAGGAEKRTIVLVTRERAAKPSVRVDNGRLVIAGGSDAAVTEACMDYVLRYWKHAKDAGARKVGLVEAPLGEGGMKTDLD